MCVSLDRSPSPTSEVLPGFAAHFHGGVHATSARARRPTDAGQARGATSGTEAAREGATAAQAAAGEETTLLIAAAASLEAVFEDQLIPMVEEANPGIQVEGTYASSGDLQQQIESGLEADLFMSAATSNMDTLVEEGLVDQASVVNLLKNDVVLIVPEGVEAMVPYRGSINDLLTQLVGGLRSGLSYAGATTIEELHEHAEFIKMSPAGLQESLPHDVN